jgi:sterol desaturase/sphingolipid hydroxylase (fatty acid hydroxylase superfamily)
VVALVGTVVGACLLAVLLTAAEWSNPEDREPQPRPRRGTRADLAWFFVYLAYAPITALGVSAAVSTISRHGLARGAIDRVPWAIQLVFALVVAELCAYWLHRAMHRIPRLWRMHAVHHGATDLRWWSTFRFHPVDGVFAHAVPLLVAAACGFGPPVVAGYLAIVFVVTMFAHADVWIPGRLLTRVVAVPAFHRRHHEVGRDDTNFALVLPIVDRIFGTWSVNNRETDGQRSDVGDRAQRDRLRRIALAPMPDQRSLEIDDPDLDRDQRVPRAYHRGDQWERDEKRDRMRHEIHPQPGRPAPLPTGSPHDCEAQRVERRLDRERQRQRGDVESG